jgi:hypothetical protein
MPPEQIGFWIGVIVGGAIAGTICGILPLVLAQKKGLRGLGVGSFIACIISGVILGLILAVPVSIVFTIIVASSKGRKAPQPPVAYVAPIAPTEIPPPQPARQDDGPYNQQTQESVFRSEPEDFS